MNGFTFQTVSLPENAVFGKIHGTLRLAARVRSARAVWLFKGDML